MTRLSHSFQPLDNKTPDIIEINGRCLDNSDPHEQKKRQIFISQISKVVNSGRKEKDESSSIAIYYINNEFVIETILEEKDSVGRTTPIISYGQFPEYEAESVWIDNVIKDIKRFAKQQIDYHLSINNNKELLERIKLILNIVWDKKKRKAEKLDYLFRLFLGIMIPLILVVILLQIPQKVQEEIPQPVLNWLLEIQVLQSPQKQTPPPSIMQVALFLALNNALMISLPKMKISKIIR